MTHDPAALSKPADAVAAALVDRAPPGVQPYLRLMRLDRPIGTWLLYWPCVFGLVLGACAESRPFGTLHDIWYVVLFGIGAIVMRGAGCTYNDIVDRDFDAQVARTRGRPIPSGAVSVRQAWAFAFALCFVGLVILLQFNLFAVALGAGSLLLVAAYPFMKRITWWPQAFLGLAFSWGALVGGAAVAWPETIPMESWLLYAGCIAWVIGYDTIYALQDREDDALIGVRSTARLFGARWRLWVSVFYVVALFLWGAASWFAGAQWPTFLALAAVGGVFVWPMLNSVDADKPASSLAAFKYNAWIGLAVIVAFSMEPLWRTLRGMFG